MFAADDRHPMTPVGWPTSFTEEYVNHIVLSIAAD
jgi:hypothetical protein